MWHQFGWNIQDIEIYSTLVAFNFNQLLIKVIFDIQSNVDVSQISFEHLLNLCTTSTQLCTLW